MALKGTLESRICYRIKRSKDSVFLRKDFEDIGGYDQIGRILRQLVDKEALIYLGYGTYARAKRSAISGALVPEKPLPELAKEAMRKLGIKTAASTAEKAYNAGRTRILRLSKEEAIQEVLKAHKLENKIKAVAAVTENTLLKQA